MYPPSDLAVTSLSTNFWKRFDQVVMLAIGVNSVCLSLQGVWGSPALEMALTLLFICEFIVKVIAMGFLCGENAYLQDRWNWPDQAPQPTGLACN